MIYNVIKRRKKTTPISDVDVGSSVYCKVDGVRTEFLIVQKGNPDTSIYDSSCDGIWLLAKDLSDKSIFYDRNYTYEARIDLWKYLNNTLRPKLDVGSIIKEAKVPPFKFFLQYSHYRSQKWVYKISMVPQKERNWIILYMNIRMKHKARLSVLLM